MKEMQEQESGFKSWSNSGPSVDESYQSVCKTAAAALVLGIASLLAFLSTAALALPILAIICCAVAMHRIRNNPDMLTGTNLARTGLFLAVFSLVGAPIYGQLFLRAMKAQTNELCREFVDHLTANQPERAMQLELSPWGREIVPNYAQLQAKYLEGPANESLMSFQSEDAVQMLELLGDNATLGPCLKTTTSWGDDELYIMSEYEVLVSDRTAPAVPTEDHHAPSPYSDPNPITMNDIPDPLRIQIKTKRICNVQLNKSGWLVVGISVAKEGGDDDAAAAE